MPQEPQIIHRQQNKGPASSRGPAGSPILASSLGTLRCDPQPNLPPELHAHCKGAPLLLSYYEQRSYSPAFKLTQGLHADPLRQQLAAVQGGACLTMLLVWW